MKHLNQDLSACKISGNTLFLPSKPLQDYQTLRKVLLKAGGTYKSNTFIFPSPAQEYIDKLIGGESIDLKKEFQFFETPKPVINKMLNLIDWSIIPRDARILEPSAGQGAILTALFPLIFSTQIEIDVIELMDINCSVLESKGYTVSAFDFMTWPEENKYDLIVANPPFTKGQDIAHIAKMYNHLKDGGQLISVCSTSYQHNEQRKYQLFREWLEARSANFTEVEEGAFKKSGTNIRTVIIHIRK